MNDCTLFRPATDLKPSTCVEDLNLYLHRLSRPAKAALRLYCFPYAGGSAGLFRSWIKRLAPSVELVGVQLPGRGPRLAEAPMTRCSRLVASITAAIAAEHRPYPFAFFGHSMGALLAYEVSLGLREQGLPQPQMLVVSGRAAPHSPVSRRPVETMNDADFIDELRRLNGTPKEILDHPELLALMLPAVRADFQVLDSWRYRESAPLTCPLIACAGRWDEHVAVDRIAAWQPYTLGPFELHEFAGGHFFLHEREAELTRVVDACLASLHG